MLIDSALPLSAQLWGCMIFYHFSDASDARTPDGQCLKDFLPLTSVQTGVGNLKKQ